MLEKLKELANDPQVRQALAAAATRSDAVDVLRVAGAKKGYKFSADSVAQALQMLLPQKQQELTEEELLAVSGGLRCNTSMGFPPPPITMHHLGEC